MLSWKTRFSISNCNKNCNKKWNIWDLTLITISTGQIGVVRAGTTINTSYHFPAIATLWTAVHLTHGPISKATVHLKGNGWACRDQLKVQGFFFQGRLEGKGKNFNSQNCHLKWVKCFGVSNFLHTFSTLGLVNYWQWATESWLLEYLWYCWNCSLTHSNPGMLIFVWIKQIEWDYLLIINWP